MEMLLYKDYTGSANFSIEDNCYWGKIENIRDLVTFESAEIDGLKKQFEEAVNDYIAYYAEVKKV